MTRNTFSREQGIDRLVHLVRFGAGVGGRGRRQDAVKIAVAGSLGKPTTSGIPDARRFRPALILELDVQASHDGLESFKSGPALGRRGFEAVHDRRLQAARVCVVVVFTTLFPGADILHGERATADVRLGATGRETLYERAPELAKTLAPSPRGELEITDVNKVYLERGDLNVELMGRGYTWLDMGTHASLLQASNFIQVMEERQGLKISCPEEIAFMKGFIDAAQVEKLANHLLKSGYGQYINKIAKN